MEEQKWNPMIKINCICPGSSGLTLPTSRIKDVFFPTSQHQLHCTT